MKKQIIWRRSLQWMAGVFLAVGCIYFWICLPKPLFNAPFSPVMFGQDGALIGARAAQDQQWRFPPMQEKLPEKFVKSLLAFEDKRFYEHVGVDLFAMLRATLQNIQAGQIVSGGSTITMQTIRIARGNPSRTVFEKLREAVLAFRLELSYRKEDILKFYASYAPFGGNTVGIEAAAWRYFGRSAHDLSWAESATLAVLPNAPALIHPGKNRDELKQKRDRLLKQLFEQHEMDAIDYELALAEPLPLAPKPLPQIAPRLLETLMHQQRNSSQPFYTTIQPDLQLKIRQVAKNYGKQLAHKSIHNLAILVIDNDNFHTVAYVGNSPFGDLQKHGHAMDLIHRARSTGSVLKPFLYAAMIEDGELLPETLVADTPIYYPGYTPKNYDRQYHGAVAAKTALTRSLNIPAANLLSQHGVAKFQQRLMNLGMTTLHRLPTEYGLTLVLGGAEGTLWEISDMYANLARLAQQTRYARINYYQKPVVLTSDAIITEKKSEYSVATAWMTLDMLLEVKRPGAEKFWQKFKSSQKIAWKTGTSFGHRDAWAVGVTPKYTVGVWVGNADGRDNPDLVGTKIAAPLLFDVFNQLPRSKTWFAKPYWQMKTIKICKDDGFLATDLCEAKSYQIPLNSHYDQITPNHIKVFLDQTGQWRVDGRCESVHHMQSKNWFVLPPDQAHFYQQFHANYQSLPPWRPDCQVETPTASVKDFKLLYPAIGTEVFLPKDIDGKQSQAVFHAIHQDPNMTLFWHLDHRYLGATQVFHQLPVYVEKGLHVVTVVDENGQKIERSFVVVGD